MKSMYVSNQEADGTWHLKVFVDNPTDPKRPFAYRKRVRGDRDHVGGLIQKIVDTLTEEEGDVKHDYSEYELWWEEENKWLLKHHWLLDKYSIQVNYNLC